MRKKSVMRFISAALAACMMASTLPVGAFALEVGTAPESSVSVQEDDTVVLPIDGEGFDENNVYWIRQGGTYELKAGHYTGQYRIVTDDDLTINITGNITFTNGYLLYAEKAGTMQINNSGDYTVDGTGYGTHFVQLFNATGETTITGGTYKSEIWNTIIAQGKKLTLNNVKAVGVRAHPLVNIGSYVVANDCEFICDGKPSERVEAAVWNFNSSSRTDLNRVDASSDEITIRNDGGTMYIDGGKYSTTSAVHAAIQNTGKLYLNDGTVTAPNSTAIKGETTNSSIELNGGTIKESPKGIEVLGGKASLKETAFANNKNDIYLGADQTITIDQNYTDVVTVGCANAKDGRQITTSADGQDKLNLVSNNVDANGKTYVVAYDEAGNYRYLAQRTGYTVTAVNATAATADGPLSKLDQIAKDTEVTLTANTAPEGKEFSGWKFEKVTANGTEEISVLTEADPENPGTATFTMPDTDVKIHARRNRLFTVSVDNGSVTKGTGIPGTEVTATATVGENQKFDHWEVTFADKDVKLVDIGLKKTDLTNPKITFNIPKSNVSLKAVCKDMHTVTINGKEVRTEKVEGDSITINAAEAGVSLDKFERWKTNDLPLSEAELTNPSLTFTMPDSDVVLEIVEKETYTVTVNHGKANGAKTVDVKPGTEVTLTADTRTGYVFVGWKVETEDADGNPVVTVANAKNETTSFIMPHCAVVLTADHEQLHTVTVNYKTDGGAETKYSEQKAIYGDKITVTANDRTAENLAFDHWEVTVDGNATDLLDNAKAEEAHFDMRRGEVVATAVYKQLHTISVHDGHAEVNGQTAEKAKEGDTVTVVPDTKLHKRFKSWKDDKGNTSLNGTTGTTFVMPNDAVDLTAEYVELYALDVTYGKAYDENHNVVNEAAAGDKITVEADEAKPDQIFTGWTVAGVDLGEDQKNPSIEFDMPSGKVTLKANYSYVHDQKVTVKYGTEDDAETEKTIYTPGNPVEITAKSRRSEDLVFDHWTVEQGTGVQLADEKAESTSFTMPESAVEIVLVAHYEQLHKITINDGTATGDKLLEMADGKSVGAVKGAEITIEAAVKDNQVFDSWTVEQGDVTLEDDTSEETTFTMGEKEVVITANYKNLHKITVHGDTGDEELDYTKIIQNVKEGAEQEITANEIDGKRFDHWIVNSDDFTLTDDEANPLVIDAMPNSDLDLTAKYVDLYALTVDNGTAYDKDNHIADEAAADDIITVKADALTGLESFVGWKLKVGTITKITVDGVEMEVSTDDDGYLLDADGNKITAESFTFTMPAGKVELQAVTSIPAYPMSFPVKILEGVAAGDTITTGGAVTVDGEPVQYTVKPGQTVKITADAPDESVYPGMVFDYWEIKSNVEVILDDANSETTTFTMPKGYVILTPHWTSSAVVVNPDEPFDPGFVVEPEAPADGSGAVIGVAAAGAAIWGGYEITTRVILNDLLPEGAAIPTNRGELAMLIWTQKGKPEPAAEPDFTDVSDTELAKAAQWCVEQGLLTAEDGKFEPDGWTPKWRVIQVWNQAFPKE